MFCFLAADSLFTVYGALYVIDYPEFNLTPNSLISIIYKVAIILASEIIIQFRDHRRSIDDCLSVNIAFVRVDLVNVGRTLLALSSLLIEEGGLISMEILLQLGSFPPSFYGLCNR